VGEVTCLEGAAEQPIDRRQEQRLSNQDMAVHSLKDVEQWELMTKKITNFTIFPGLII
jgi:hypothetical protein